MRRFDQITILTYSMYSERQFRANSLDPAQKPQNATPVKVYTVCYSSCKLNTFTDSKMDF